MMNILAYAGCLHRFEINENGYLQIDIYGYDSNTERFVNIIEKPLIPSRTMKSNKCTIVGSCLIDKGLGILLQLITSNSSILMFLQLQSRPWLCQIVYTLAIPILTYGSVKFLAINSLWTIFINEEKQAKGFYMIDNRKEKCQRNIEFLSCSLLTYIYCYLKENYYWLMGNEMDFNTERKLIKVYYGCSTSPSTPLVSFNTTKLIPISLVDNIQDIYIINHQIQLKPPLILGDVIISSHDHRILTCHHGTISHELSMTNSITSIQSYHTIENEHLFLCTKNDLPSVEIFQFNENFTLIPFTNTNETADLILIDDFLQLGWKQILFLKNRLNLHSFILTDFSQIHIFQQESDDEYNTEEKRLSIEIDDGDIRISLILAQDILRKKIINADFIIHEGYFQCKQIENDIRKITNQYHIPDLNLQQQSDSLTITTSIIQLIDTNWFFYQTNLFLYVTIKNLSNTLLTSIHLFGIDKHSNKTKFFNLKPASQSFLTESMIFNLNPHSSLTFILTTFIELDKNMDIELYLLINDHNQLYHIGSMAIIIDDLINANNERRLNINVLENNFGNNLMDKQAVLYLNTLVRLSVNMETTSKFHLIEHFQQLLSTLGFQPILNLSNVYIRIKEGNIFEHVLIHLVNEDDLIIHFYAKNSHETTMLAKYILSKLDFQSFSLVDSLKSFSQEGYSKILTRIQLELTSYIDILKQVPTIMRKLAPTSKSESYRLLKFDNFRSFQNERLITDLLLASLITD